MTVTHWTVLEYRALLMNELIGNVDMFRWNEMGSA